MSGDNLPLPIPLYIVILLLYFFLYKVYIIECHNVIKRIKALYIKGLEGDKLPKKNVTLNVIMSLQVCNLLRHLYGTAQYQVCIP